MKGVIILGLIYAAGALAIYLDDTPTAAAKTETLSCVRVKEVTPAGTINYLCEVRK